MNVDKIPYLSLFAGVGGLDLGLRIAIDGAICIGLCDREFAAIEILESRIEEGSIENAPIFTDVRSFPGELYRGRVAGILAGFPCPDYSVAGKRAGIVGKHGQLWDDLADVIRDVGPDWVFMENVPGIYVPHGGDAGAILPAGLWFVLGDLAALGFDAEWLCLRASDVGASHGRARWFCLAYRKGRGFCVDELGNPTGNHEQRDTVSGIDREGLAAGGSERGQIRGIITDRGSRELPLFAPGPSDPRWPAILTEYPWLAPAISEEEVERLLHYLADGSAASLACSRTDGLRACGNGVVALQVALAFTVLARRVGLIL